MDLTKSMYAKPPESFKICWAVVMSLIKVNSEADTSKNSHEKALLIKSFPLQ